jgi:hypothetical protein
VLSLARSPGRFIVVAMLGLAVLFALALRSFAAGRRRPIVLLTVGVLTFAELVPAPRPLYSTAIPRVYARVADDPRPDIRLLELPVGMRDGTSSVGNFHARAQFFQTYHGKPLLGGYLSRVSRRRIRELPKYQVFHALTQLSEGATLDPERLERLCERAATFTARHDIHYAVIDRGRASAALVQFAEEHLKLRKIDSDAGFDLYVPAQP